MSFVSGFGISNIDILFGQMPRVPQLGEEVFSKNFSMQLGGGPVATIILLANLGVPVKLATYVGHGDFSCFLREQLAWRHISYVNMLQSREPEPLTISSIISCTADRSIVSYRPQKHTFTINEEDLYQFYKGSQIAYIPIEYSSLCKKLKKEGCIIVMDSFWDDNLCMDWYRDIFPYIDYFTPNEKEAMKITETFNAEEALNVLSKYLPLAIVKLGENGCLLRKNGVTTHVPAADFSFVDSTGAGDAFLSGLLYGIYYGYDALDCVRLGNITGGNAITRIGCLTAEMNETDLADYYLKYYHHPLEQKKL